MQSTRPSLPLHGGLGGWPCCGCRHRRVCEAPAAVEGGGGEQSKAEDEETGGAERPGCPGFHFGCKRTDGNLELNVDLTGVKGNKTPYLERCVIPEGKESPNATSLLGP